MTLGERERRVNGDPVALVSPSDGGVSDAVIRGGACDCWLTRGTEGLSLLGAVGIGIFESDFDSGFNFGVSENYME